MEPAFCRYSHVVIFWTELVRVRCCWLAVTRNYFGSFNGSIVFRTRGRSRFIWACWRSRSCAGNNFLKTFLMSSMLNKLNERYELNPLSIKHCTVSSSSSYSWHHALYSKHLTFSFRMNLAEKQDKQAHKATAKFKLMKRCCYLYHLGRERVIIWFLPGMLITDIFMTDMYIQHG